ncbi:YbhB/YbcL family Raf kinase inhibitor-like protein [Noviherbaspirillum saxi]|uniref:YbhB/YbcL family Raf kinase inhibitor-like protein n=1 Tax=Noviherbaspirillum saxi TaxID=2320863 RepID=A0A3A3FZG9_9BURK|nr:YbhB/YbcL family Raf kinase inhibitor-like protein [Noviherbaspirillum saxi]RJF99591.1 YbhB/YbcL family Raf kinase inhibitor-like protein [Noviherbaspirillum saxi]
MKLWSDSFKNGEPIPGEFAFGVIDPAAHVALSTNRNPHLAWSDLPSGTKSLVLICHDRDVPSRGDDVNQEGKTVPADLPRVDFFHWTLIDLPPSMASIAAAQYSSEVTARGKPGPDIGGSRPGRHGLNDYTGWFAGDPNMAGDYCGYDGPCPPWNDAIVHHYVFTLFALDVDRLDASGKFTGQQVREAMRGHILGEAKIVGTYTLNPQVAGAR